MTEHQLKTGQDLIKKVLENDEAYLKSQYKYWRTDFKRWFEQKYKLNDRESSELYQDAFLQLFVNIREQKVQTIEHPRTYLYGIGKNLMRQKFRLSGRLTGMDETEHMADPEDFIRAEDRREDALQVAAMLEDFGDPCREILLMFYFRKYSHEVIAERLGYKNSQVVKKKKSLCMTELRKRWKKK